MNKIKKTILTLVALLALTGAWAADVLNIVVDGTSATIKYDGNASNNPYFGGDEWKQSEFPWDNEYSTRPTITTVTIDGSCKNFSGTSLRSLFIGFSGLTTINGLDNLNTANVQDMEYMFADCSSLTSLDLSSLNTASLTTMSNMFAYCSKLTSLDLSSWNTENVEVTSSLFLNCSELTTVDLSSWNTAKVWNTGYMFYNCPKLENIYVGDGWSTAKVTQSDDMFTGCTKLLSMNTANPATNKTNAHTGDGGYLKVKPAAATGPEVDWNKTAKTGTFTMPGGNVTLEPEYYPQATVADGGVTAADADARATTDDPLVKVDATKLTGAKKLMYFVSNSGTTAPAYDAEGWTDQLPTAEGFTQQGIVYVWYYPVGIDEGVDGATATYSDGDICLQSITARIAPEPTYAVTFAEGTDPNEWTASPNADVTKGQTVTVTYTGAKKVIGVKAEKKAAEPVLLTTITAADNSSFKSGSQTFGDVATVTLTGDYLINDGSHGGWYCQGSNKTATISVAEANGANITSVKFYTAGGGSAEDKDAPFEVTTTTVTSSDITTYLNGNSIGSYGVSKIEVYGTK